MRQFTPLKYFGPSYSKMLEIDLLFLLFKDCTHLKCCKREATVKGFHSGQGQQYLEVAVPANGQSRRGSSVTAVPGYK